MNEADFDLMVRQAETDLPRHIVWLENKIRTLMTEIRALESDVERLGVDTHYLRQENEQLRRGKPEVLR